MLTLISELSNNSLAYLLIVVVIMLIIIERLTLRRLLKFRFVESNVNSEIRRYAPGPPKYPIIGNLKELHGYKIPYQAFSDLARKYGPIIGLQLGSVSAIVVNGIDNIKEVLLTKTSEFDSRPNFQRYHQLFSGNKENSLAFCDWSELHRQRREMLIPHTFPRNFSKRFQELDTIIVDELGEMVTAIEKDADAESSSRSPNFKKTILKYCCNIFAQYFCTRRFESDDPKFERFVSNFDKIFYEVNQGYAADFLPFLMPFHSNNLRQMENWSQEIRSILLEKIIENRFDENIVEKSDYVDCLIGHVKVAQPIMDWNTALFALEDIVGGHSAVGNFILKMFGYIVQNPQVQQRVQNEIDQVLEASGESAINLKDRKSMPYTEAVIMEALRLIASPIVPHVSNQKTTIGGYDTEPNTLVFLNNYDLSMSPDLWNQPELFQPERFIQNGHVLKPEFFLPFGGGRRSCLGYKMVQLISFSTISNILNKFRITPVDGQDYNIQAGSLAASENPFQISFEPRNL